MRVIGGFQVISSISLFLSGNRDLPTWYLRYMGIWADEATFEAPFGDIYSPRYLMLGMETGICRRGMSRLFSFSTISMERPSQ